MGMTFLNTHVRTSNVRAVAKALAKLAVAEGLTPAKDGEPCDHDVVVTTNPASKGWTSFYRRFGEVSWQLSEELATHVVVTAVDDSDVLELRLYNDGVISDAFCTHPETMDGESRSSLKGQPRRWDDLCVAGKSWKDVQKVFRSAAAAPEVALVALGKLLGLDASSFYPEHVDPDGPDVVRLRFRRPPPPRRRIVETAPALRTFTDQAWELSLGSAALPGGTMASSVGGTSRGMRIAIGGEAIAKGLVFIDAISFRRMTSEVVERIEADGRWFVAEFSNGGLPAASGLVDANDAVPVADRFPDVNLEVAAMAMQAGNAELLIRWTALDPVAEPHLQRITVRVAAPPPRR